SQLQPGHSDRLAELPYLGGSPLAQSSIQSIRQPLQKLDGCTFDFASFVQTMMYPESRPLRAITVEVAAPAAIGDVLHATRVPLQAFNLCVRMNLAIFLDWKTILESKIPMIEATDADKTSNLLGPAGRISRLLGRFQNTCWERI